MQTTATLSWFSNDGSGTFSAGTPLPAIPGAYQTRIAVGDIDSHGDHDVLAQSLLQGSFLRLLHVYENLGGGIFAPPTTRSAGDSAIQPLLLDLDADGHLQAVLVHAGTLSVHWGLLHHGQPFETTFSVAQGTSFLFDGDFDGDGDLDFISASQSRDEFVLHRNAGSGQAFGFEPLAVLARRRRGERQEASARANGTRGAV